MDVGFQIQHIEYRQLYIILNSWLYQLVCADIVVLYQLALLSDTGCSGCIPYIVSAMISNQFV